MHQISKNIKQLRTANGWTQQEMADMLFVTRQTVSNWENGKAMPDVETLIQISEKLNIDVNQLVYGKKEEVNSLKTEIGKSILWIGTMMALNRVITNVYSKNYWLSFNSLGMFSYFLILKPVALFFAGVLVIQLLKGMGVITHIKGSKHLKKFRIAMVVLLIAAVISQFRTIRYDVLSIMSHFKLGPFVNSNGYNGMDWQLNMPQYWEAFESFFYNILFSGERFYKPPYYLVCGVLGAIYELMKPFSPNSKMTFEKETQIIKNAGNKIREILHNPVEFCKFLIQFVKDTFIFTNSKPKFIPISVILLAVLYFLQLITSGYTPLFKKWIYSGLTAPLTMCTAGAIVAACIKHTATFSNGVFCRYRKVFLSVLIILFTVNFMVFLPEVLREIMVISDRLGIITVTGSYDITGFVLRPPQWYSKIYHYLYDINNSSQVWKWAIPGLICELSIPYNEK